MPVFEYEVVDRSGAIGRGRQQAEDQAELMQQLRDRGQLVVSLRATDAPRAAPLRQALQHSFRRVTGSGGSTSWQTCSSLVANGRTLPFARTSWPVTGSIVRASVVMASA